MHYLSNTETIVCKINAFNVYKAKIFVFWWGFNSLPKDEILGWSKLKAWADNKIITTENLNFVLWRVEKIVGKEENAVTSIFSFPYNVFKRVLFGWSL